MDLIKIFKKKESGFGDIILHNDNSLISKIPGLKFLAKPSNLIMFSILIFSVLGLIGVFSNTFFAQIPQVEQQVTETGKVLLSIEPAASSENMFFFFLISLILSFVNFYTFKYKWEIGVNYLFRLFLIPLIIGLLWMGLHSVRYGSSDLALLGVFTFGFFGALLTLLFESLIVWWTWHILNNLFFKINEFQSDDLVLITVIGVLFVVFTI